MSKALLKAGIEPDPIIEVYKKDVDRTLIRESLRLSVEERLSNLQALYDFAQELRRAGMEARRKKRTATS